MVPLSPHIFAIKVFLWINRIFTNYKTLLYLFSKFMNVMLFLFPHCGSLIYSPAFSSYPQWFHQDYLSIYVLAPFYALSLLLIVPHHPSWISIVAMCMQLFNMIFIFPEQQMTKSRWCMAIPMLLAKALKISHSINMEKVENYSSK